MYLFCIHIILRQRVIIIYKSVNRYCFIIVLQPLAPAIDSPSLVPPWEILDLEDVKRKQYS